MATQDNKNIILITGANGGIGFETAAQLLTDAANHVIIGSRSAEKGEAALKDLESRNLAGTVRYLQLEVTSKDSIEAAVKQVEKDHGKLDVLINNAAVAMTGLPPHEDMPVVFATNVTGPYLITHTFAPLLKKSSTPRIINVTSGVGSLTRKADKTDQMYKQVSYGYRTSKAALNMMTLNQRTDYELQGENFKFFMVCPGFTVSNLGPHNNAESGAQPTSEGARAIVETARGERDAQEGTAYSAKETYDW